MEVIILANPEAVARTAADHVCHLIAQQGTCTLGLPTGQTSVGLYQELVARYRRGEVDFSQTVTFNLDEYVGLPADHPASYYRFMAENLFTHVNIPKDNVHIPNGMAEDIRAECLAYEKELMDNGGIDLQILGIGRDGHIAFNEPTSSLSSRTRLKTLTAKTRQDNSKNFSKLDDVPRQVITMGVGTIMEARKIILLATGEGKAQAIADTVEGPVSAMCPASILQFHQTAKIIIDEAAASKLKQIDYYKSI